MHQILVEEKRWVSENRFLHALNYCMLLPGTRGTAARDLHRMAAPRHRWRADGGHPVCAARLPGDPGTERIARYALFQGAGPVEAVLFGLKPAVMAIVLEAVIRELGRRALKNVVMAGIAVVAFVAIFFFDVPFPLIVLSAAVIGLRRQGRLLPDLFQVIRGHPPVQEGDGVGPAVADDAVAHIRPTASRTVRVLLVWLCLWFVPLGLLNGTRGRNDILVQEGIFFSKAR